MLMDECKRKILLCPLYSDHRKKVYIWKLAKYSKEWGAKLIIRGLPYFLHREYSAPPGIDLGPLYFMDSAISQVYTFFWWRL